MWRVLLFICLVTVSARAVPTESWDPKTTWVFAVGVIRFDDPAIESYPQKGRVDAQMIAAFKRRGVPEDHVVFLKDKEATKGRIMRELKATLAKTAAGDTLVFYYAGHGSRDYQDAERPVSFITYDSGTGWRIKEVLDAIREFRGQRVLLMADCCYSGGLAEEAKSHNGPVAFAALTSAQPTSTSTGEWTFTQTITDMLNGDALLDLNRDGVITLRETATYLNAEMAFCEGQLSSFTVTGGFPADLLMAQTKGLPLPEGAGTRCEGREDGKWLKVTILKTEGKRSFVTWVSWEHSEDSWLSADELRPYHPPTVPVGSSVRIEWEGKWYPGKVLRNELGLQLVHYNGYGDIDDEWVTPERLKVK